MTPKELKGLFSKFRDLNFRDYQQRAIEFALDSEKPVSVIWAPTGFGKSLTAACIGAAFGDFTYLVASKQLQNQLNEDFPEIKILKGRANYQCLYNESTHCGDCINSPLSPCPHKAEGQCPYEVEKMRVYSSPYKLLNYAYFLTEANFIGMFSNQEILICDEGDVVESLLTDFISLEISGYMMRRFKLPKPKYKAADGPHKLKEWIEWADQIAIPKVNEGRREITSELKRTNEDDPQYTKLLKRRQLVSGVISRLKIFMKYVDETWIFQEIKSQKRGVPDGISFKPIWTPEELSEKFFFRHAKKFVFLSATFPPVQIMGKLLGQDPKNIDFIDLPSSFPVDRRQVYINVSGNLTNKTFDDEAPKIANRVIEIINENPDVKGIVHSVSYKLAKMITDAAMFTDADQRIITHDSKDREQIIDRFKKSDEPLVLISPSIERGLDLPGDLCRLIVWAKCPFLSLGDKLTSQRVYSGRLGSLWYRSLAAQVIVQGCGRGMRSKEDHCVTYVLDAQIKQLLFKNRQLFPKYFFESLETF